MAKINITPVNLTIKIAQLDAISKALTPTVNRSSKKLADQILEDSRTISPTVPVKTGALMSTGRVKELKNGHAIIYGGRTSKGSTKLKLRGVVDYANEVHDDLRPRNYTVSGSGPKFLTTHGERRAREIGILAGPGLLKLTRIFSGG